MCVRERFHCISKFFHLEKTVNLAEDLKTISLWKSERNPSPRETQVQHFEAHWFRLGGPTLHFQHKVKKQQHTFVFTTGAITYCGTFS